MQIVVRNVNEALHEIIEVFKTQSMIDVSPRGHRTLELEAPLMTVYLKPWERVLFSPTRDANPFFHLFEALWMLKGRDDVGFVEKLNKRMREFSDDGEKFYGAYGWRWRNAFGFDQLDSITGLLNSEPDSRRAVLSMWSPGDLRFTGRSKDIPCNTHVYFKVRNKQLRTTICCRSNDLLWGAYGANGVHFSMLHEYVAYKLGVAQGPMYQLSDSAHIYLDGPGGKLWKTLSEDDGYLDLYTRNEVHVGPLWASDSGWDDDLARFFQAVDKDVQPVLVTPWWKDVAWPMWMAWKTRDVYYARLCAATDWGYAAEQWILRRQHGNDGATRAAVSQR